MKKRFGDKVALVTGGNSGMGMACAIAFAREGAKVVIAARRAQKGEEAMNMIKEAGGEGIFIKTDVSQSSEVEAMVKMTVETFGRLDCAFNNAGVVRGGSTHEFPEEEWDRRGSPRPARS